MTKTKTQRAELVDTLQADAKALGDAIKDARKDLAAFGEAKDGESPDVTKDRSAVSSYVGYLESQLEANGFAQRTIKAHD